MTTTYTVEELLGDLLGEAAAHIGYWAKTHRLNSTSLTFTDREDEDAKPHTVTAEQITAWATGDGPYRLAALLGSPEQREMVHSLASAVRGIGDPLDADYDAETADCLIQFLALDGILYS